MWDWIGRITCTLFVAAFFYAVSDRSDRADKCNALGGVYIESQCFKAELIPMED